MAYVKLYEARYCQRPGCRYFATLVVCNAWNAPIGYYCDRHRKLAEAFAAQLTAGEQRGPHIPRLGSAR